MKSSYAEVAVTFWLAATFVLVSSSQGESGDKGITTTQRKHTSAHAIHIVDQNGRPAVSGVPSGTDQIVDVAVGQGGFLFVPDTVNISVGDTVRWTWGSDDHSVTSGTSCTADGQFCSPDNMNCDAGILNNTGFVYEHTFTQAGTYSYFCALHCFAGMTGVINVRPPSRPHPTPRPRPTPLPRPVPPQ